MQKVLPYFAELAKICVKFLNQNLLFNCKKVLEATFQMLSQVFKNMEGEFIAIIC
jgi:hypothetical protein